MYTRSTTPTVATAGSRRSTWPHSSVEPEQSTSLTDGELVDGKVSGDTVGTDVFPITFRIQRARWSNL